jgi:hypothetical protein
MSDLGDIIHRGPGIPSVTNSMLAYSVGVAVATLGVAVNYSGFFKLCGLWFIDGPSFWIIQGAYVGSWFSLWKAFSRLNQTQKSFGSLTSDQILIKLLPYENADMRSRHEAARGLVDYWKKASLTLWVSVALVATLGPVLVFIDLAGNGFTDKWLFGTLAVFTFQYLLTAALAIGIQRRWDLLVDTWVEGWLNSDSQSAKASASLRNQQNNSAIQQVTAKLLEIASPAATEANVEPQKTQETRQAQEAEQNPEAGQASKAQQAPPSYLDRLRAVEDD